MIQRLDDDELVIIKTGTPVSGRVFLWSMMFYYKGLVIDCGCPNSAEDAYNALKTLGDIKAVLVTHHHEDHVGCAYILGEKGIPVYAHSISLPILRNPPMIPEYRKIVWGQPKPVDPFPVTKEMNIGGMRISVYETPGHSDDHVIYLIDDLLFIGDLISSLRPMIAFYRDDYGRILESVKNILLNLEFKKAYGGHVILTRDDVKRFVEYLEDLRMRIMDLRKKGVSTRDMLDILWDKIPEKVHMMEAVSEGEWHRKYLVDSLL